MVGHAGSPTGIVRADMTLTQGEGYWAFELPKIAENCTFLGLSPLPFWRGAQNLSLIVIAWDLAYSPIFRFLSKKAITITSVQTLRNVDITRISNGHISQLLQATVTWSETLVVLYVLRMLIYDLDLIQGQGQGH